MKSQVFPANPYPEFNSRRDWENQSVTQINRETQHAPWGAYTTVGQALACDREASPRVMSLDGEWKFTLADRPENVPAGFWADGFDASQWASIQVPGNWELQGFGKPIYTNHIMPWPIDAEAPYLVKPTVKSKWTGEEHLLLNPPQVPAENPTGCYVRTFDLPADWNGLDVHMWFGGVESAFHLWINGRPVGYSQDSKLPCDFDVTRFLRPGANAVALQVERWSDGTWLEDQDYWYLSGVFRSVRLVAKPPVHIRDWFVTAIPDEHGDGATWRGEIFLQQRDGYADHKVKVELFDGDGAPVASAEAMLNRHSWYAHETGNAFHFEARVDGAKRWTPETPALYTTVITLLDADGATVDIESCRTGFRRIEIGSDGVIRLNGVRMIFRGVNRHEHALRFGRAVPKDHMRREIIEMKRLNFNAVRTCHYPDSPEWYDLCDEMGICLVCEADLETHALGGLASTDPSWAAAYLERAVRMVLVHKNHPAIVSWSMGNESLCGPNHAAMANWIRAYDSTRLVQYESGAPKAIVSDIRGNMYAHPEYIMRMLGDLRDPRPVVLVEYLYQIRNSGGGMYWFPRLVEEYERFQGGFVWDWQDKCLVAKDPATGEEFQGYGGDFGEEYKERVCPYHMTCNGVVLADITPKPVAYEVKEAQSPLRVVAANDENARAGRFLLRNRHHATGTSGFAIRAVAKVDGVETVSRDIPVPAAAPMSDAPLNVDLKEFFPERPAGSELHLDFIVTLAADTPWAKAGHEISHTQFAIPSPAPAYAPKAAPAAPAAKASLEEGRDEIRVAAGPLSLVFDRHGGMLASAAFDGAPLIAEGPRVNLRRPRCGLDTDAMTRWGFDGVWQRALDGLERHSGGARACALPDGSVLVETDETLVAPDGTLVASALGSYRVGPDGGIVLGTALEVSRAMDHVPRVGLSLVLPPGFENLEWFGRGPDESYCDRLEHTPVGVYASTVAEQHFPFVPPAECGGHEDTRWLRVSNSDGLFVRVSAPSRFHFDARHASVRDYLLAEHDHQLPRRPETFLDIDHLHAGIGGNMAWSTIIDGRHLVGAGGYSFRFAFDFGAAL